MNNEYGAVLSLFSRGTIIVHQAYVEITGDLTSGWMLQEIFIGRDKNIGAASFSTTREIWDKKGVCLKDQLAAENKLMRLGFLDRVVDAEIVTYYCNLAEVVSALASLTNA